MASGLTKYSYINALIRARISKLLSEELFGRMLRVRSLEEALQQLKNTPFAALDELYSKTGDLKRGELELIKEEISVFKSLARHVHKQTRDFTRAFLYRYEIDSLKNALRLFFSRVVCGRRIDEVVHYIVYEPVVNNLKYDAIVNADTMDEVIDAVSGTPYAQIIEKYRVHVTEDRSLFFLEAALDRFFFETLTSEADRLSAADRARAQHLIGLEIDLQNISWIIRYKTFYALTENEIEALLIPRGLTFSRDSIRQAYSDHGALQVVEHLVRSRYPGLSALVSAPPASAAARLELIEQILGHVMKHEIHRALTGNPFTICIIIAYFILKKNEIKRVITVLNAKKYDLSEDRIESLV
jgi:V/A-type H+-transporting ATPase subunit C